MRIQDSFDHNVHVPCRQWVAKYTPLAPTLSNRSGGIEVKNCSFLLRMGILWVSSMYVQLSQFENLLNSYQRVRKGKRYKRTTLEYDQNQESNLLFLVYLLRSRRYRPEPYTNFVVAHPKKRLVSAPAFRDRIVHRALFDLIEPLYEKQFIHDSYACRTGKGTHFAMKRMRGFLQAAHAHHGDYQAIYFLKCDIKKYFQSISWDVLLEILQKTIKDPEIYTLVTKIVTTHHPNSYGKKVNHRCGLPIGNLTSQLFANVYLNELDQFVKHGLKMKWYGRYMDDFVIIHQDKEKLKQVRDSIGEFVESHLKLKLHPQKIIIQRVSHGLPFVGYRIFHNHIKVHPKTLSRFCKRLRYRRKKVASGRREPKELMAMVDSFSGHLGQANAKGLQRHIRGLAKIDTELLK